MISDRIIGGWMHAIPATETIEFTLFIRKFMFSDRAFHIEIRNPFIVA